MLSGDRTQLEDVLLSGQKTPLEYMLEDLDHKRGEPTHTLMTGGVFRVNDSLTANQSILNTLADSLMNPLVEIPCVTEQHTAVFPMYLDLDMEVPVTALSDDCIERIVSIASSQLARFFDMLPMDESLEAIVLTKKKAKELDGGRLYKHGIHVIFPKVFVVANTARQIRLGMISGLSVMRWMSMLGVEEPVWDNILDVQVYTNGLRMIGAPKASPCPECWIGRRRIPDRTSCNTCRTRFNCHKTDKTNVYKTGMILRGGVRDIAYETKLTLKQWVHKTTVRCSNGQKETPGFRVYSGCPRVLDIPGKRASSKRPRDLFVGDNQNLAARFRNAPPITDHEVIRILTAHLHRHSEKYSECVVSNVKRYNKTIIACVVGDHSQYCLNKQDYHRSNRVYMKIEWHGKQYVSRMYCFCKCAVSDRPGPSVIPLGFNPMTQTSCADFRSYPINVSKADEHVLFGGESSRSKPTASSTPLLTHNLSEIERRMDEYRQRHGM